MMRALPTPMPRQLVGGICKHVCPYNVFANLINYVVLLLDENN